MGKKKRFKKPPMMALPDTHRVIYRLFTGRQLQKFPEALPGDMVECLECGGDHKLESAVALSTGRKDSLFLIYRCRRRWEFGAIFGRLIAGRIPHHEVLD